MTILYKLDKGNHSVYALQYYYVQCVKYRKKALVNEAVVELLKNQVHRIGETFGVETLNIEADKDHFHLLFKGHPRLELVKYINAIKTITAREIRRTHPELRTIIWGDHFWSPSYFLATTG